MRTLSWNKFDGGMTNDPRDAGEDVCQIIYHIDNYTRPRKLTPHPDNDATSADRGANAFNTLAMQLFVYSNYLSTPTFYGLGVESGTQKPEIFTKINIADGTAWAASNHTGDYATLADLGGGPNVFLLYQNNIYGQDGVVGARKWWTYGDITGTPTWTRALDGGRNYINVGNAIVHSKDDIMYFSYGSGTLVRNLIGSNNAGTFSGATPNLTFQISSIISSICEYGNYLAIGVNNINDTVSVHLWDRDAVVLNIPEKIDWGSGTLKWLGVVDGTLIGCSVLEPSGFALKPTISFKYYDGSKAITFQTFTLSSATYNIYQQTQRWNNLLYFMAEMQINNVECRGIWKVVKSEGRYCVSFDRQPRLDDVVTSGDLYGFLRTGDYFHIACQTNNSSGYIVTKTGNTYATTCTFRTTINAIEPERYRSSAGLRSELKQCLAINFMTEPLTSGQGGLGYYRVDGGSWIQICNLSTSLDATLIGTVAHEFIHDSTGTPFTNGREYEFRFDPIGGTEPTEVRYKVESLESLL